MKIVKRNSYFDYNMEIIIDSIDEKNGKTLVKVMNSNNNKKNCYYQLVSDKVVLF